MTESDSVPGGTILMILAEIHFRLLYKVVLVRPPGSPCRRTFSFHMRQFHNAVDFCLSGPVARLTKH